MIVVLFGNLAFLLGSIMLYDWLNFKSQKTIH